MSIKKEAICLAVSFVAAELVNIYAIIIYDRPFSELYSMIGYVALITLIFYAVILIVRLAVKGIELLIKHKR